MHYDLRVVRAASFRLKLHGAGIGRFACREQSNSVAYVLAD